MIDTLVSQIAARLGVSTELASQAAGVFLSMLKKFGDDGAVGALLDSIPGASALASTQASVADNAGGLLGGGLAGMAGNLLGGDAGDLMKAVGAMKSLGMDADQGRQVAETTLGFLSDNADAGLLNAALDGLPWFKALS